MITIDIVVKNIGLKFMLALINSIRQLIKRLV